jgi:hypothetical protein
MSSQADVIAPVARTGDAAEDQRRDEVLCRLLNTPYRPRTEAPTAVAMAEAPMNPPGTSSGKISR